MTLVGFVRKSAYQDSVALLALARELRAGAGVREAAALMATTANKTLLAAAGLLTAEADAAGPNDLVVAIRAETPADGERARSRAEALLAARRERAQAPGRARPRTLESAARRLAGANLALISVPGAFAAGEAKKALGLGLSVMLFSDNVSLDDEVRLKRFAVERGLWLMGPDCGTAHLNGVPLGFANVVPSGSVGIVSASGTGLQQVATLLAARGEGISHAIGVGGRDLSEAIGGLMTLHALDALGKDSATEIIAIIGKPPAPGVRERVIAKIRAIGKPSVVAMLGRDVASGQEGVIATVRTLEDAAHAVLAARARQPFAPRPFATFVSDLRPRLLEARRELLPSQRWVRGLYAGGTLAHEAALILEPLLGRVATDPESSAADAHRVVDLGADQFTVGRAHPMLDPTTRIEAIGRAAGEPDVAVMLVDVVLGLGASADPAGDIAPALAAARERARTEGRGLSIVATVIGTSADPQGLASQIARLEAAGAWVLPSNAQAARAAAYIAGGDDVVRAAAGARE
jgi:FdrA protein